jgi:iron complex transport system substrate-binding protein
LTGFGARGALIRCLALAVLLAPCAWSGAPVAETPASVVDDTGQRLHLDPPALRIVALAPHLAELVFDAGAGERLVGAVRGSDHPLAVRQVPGVGNAAGIDVERVLLLRPDLVLAWASGNRASDVARLEGLGLRIFRSEPRTVDDIATTLRRIGHLAGTFPAADDAARRYEAALARIAPPAADRQPPAVFIQIWDNPLMTVSGEHLTSRLVARCGGRNVFASLPVLAGSVSLEAVLAANPALIIATVAPGREQAARLFWQRWPNLSAVAAGRVHTIDADLVARATPRIVEGLKRVCSWVAAARRFP